MYAEHGQIVELKGVADEVLHRLIDRAEDLNRAAVLGASALGWKAKNEN